MKKLLLSLLCFVVIQAFGQTGQNSVPGTFKLPRGITSSDYLPNTIIVKFKRGTSVSQIRSATSSLSSNLLNLKPGNVRQVNQVFRDNLQLSTRAVTTPSVSDTIGLDRIYEFKYNSNSGIETIINDVLRNSSVEYAEPSYIHYSSYLPNDPFFGTSQNYLRQIKADQAWDVIRNSAGVVIAIVDSGSDLDHLDLRPNILLPGKDLVGASFASLTEDDDPDVKSDSTDHGVRVSGLASAVSDNGIGISSVAFNARLLIVKAGADNNARAIYRGYEGIKYAADNGAHIINCSWGSTGGGSYGQDIVNYAISKGCLIVAAAGNENSIEPEYPAAYTGVLAVTSVDGNDRKSSFSNFGAYVSITAPGEVLTTANRSNYIVARGTSFSAPIVASAAALVKSRFPAFDMSQVKEQLRVTSDNVDALNTNYTGLLGKGRLNVFRAVTELPPSIRQQKITLVDKGRGSIPPGDTLRIFLDLKNFLSPAAGLVVRLTSGNPDVQVIDDQVSVGAVGTMQTVSNIGAFRVYIKPTIADNEQVTFALTYSADGAYTDSEQFTIRVALDYMNVAVNRVSTTISSNGRVGFSGAEATNGMGFVYKDDQLLYEGSLLIGNSATRVSNNSRNDSGGADEHFRKHIRVGKVDDKQAAFKAQSEFDDSGSSNRLNIQVKHSQTAFATAPDDKYVIVEYEIQNTGSDLLSNVYAGMLTDWDVDAAGHDVTRYDAANRTAYVSSKSGMGTFAGVRLLNKDVAAAYYPMSPQIVGDPSQNGGGLSISEKFTALSSGIKATSLGESSANGIDVMFVSGYGPYSIPANGSVKIAFAFMAGDNLADLQASGQAAQQKYELIYPPRPVVPGEGFTLAQNVPNPAVSDTKLAFTIPEMSLTSIVLYDIMGKKVRELVNSVLPQGAYNINVNVSDLSAGVYLYRMSYKGKEKTLKLMVSK